MTEFKAFLFDLDDTLYRVASIPELVRHRIGDYLREKLCVPANEVSDITTSLYIKYGTTLAGLVATGYKINYDDWHKFVHYGAIDYDLLKPDPAMRAFLDSIDVPKYIFTNADKTHMTICLKKLGIEDCFQGFFHFEHFLEIAEARKLFSSESPGILCKPCPRVYEYVAAELQLNPVEVLFFDDSVRNLLGAREVGMSTVLVGKEVALPGADMAVVNLLLFSKFLPELIGGVEAQTDGAADAHHEHRQLDDESASSVTVSVPSA